MAVVQRHTMWHRIPPKRIGNTCGPRVDGQVGRHLVSLARRVVLCGINRQNAIQVYSYDVNESRGWGKKEIAFYVW